MLSNQTSRIYCDADEMDGLESLANRLAEKAMDSGYDEHATAYKAVAITAHILASHRLNYPRDFMIVFERLFFGREYQEDE